MEFLLNHTVLFVFSLVTLLFQASFTLVSFYISKNFIKSEVNKLKNDSTHADIGLILIFGIILSIIISFLGTMVTTAVARYFYPTPDYIYNSYLELLIIFSSILLISYALFGHTKEHLRFKHVSHQDSQDIYKVFQRTIGVALLVSAISYSIINALLGTKNILIYEYVTVGFIILCCFIEATVSADLISKAMSIKKTTIHNISIRIATFLNGKCNYVMLCCMIYAVKINSEQTGELAIFSHINNIYLYPFGLLIFQSLIVAIINEFIKYINSINDGFCSANLIQKRSDNMIWICNFIVLFLYFSIICVAVQYGGINIKPYIFKEYFFVIVVGVFLTTIIYKAFNEFSDTILEKASKGDHEHYTKLETFMPTISVLFYAILFITSALIILSNIGIDVTPIVASFSIFSAAFALASQDIIKAFLHGVTLLLEKNLFIGDFIEINGKSGKIEKLSVRVVHLRAINGSLHVIPYNLITSITNYSKEYTRHTELLRLVSQNDIDKACDILRNIVENMKQEPQYKDKIFDDVIIHGLNPFDLTGIKVKWEIKTHPTLTHITHDIYHRLIKEFEKNGIEVPKIANNISVQD